MSRCLILRRLEEKLKAGLDPNDFVPDDIPMWLSKEEYEEYLMWCIVHLTDGREERARELLYESWAENVR